MLSTAEEVEKLQEELESMQPLLAQAAKDTEDTMEQIKKDSVSLFKLLFKLSSIVFYFLYHWIKKRLTCDHALYILCSIFTSKIKT